jgi:protein gp37
MPLRDTWKGKLMSYEWVDIDELIIKSAFSDLFPITQTILDAIRDDMELNGFDASKPIDVWRQEGCIIDGHTRRQAAKLCGLQQVMVFWHDFESEDDAVDYAIHQQRDRRNLNDADILRLVAMIDSRRQRGGDHKSDDFEKSKAQGCAFETQSGNGKSAEETAEKLGISARKVEQTRAILNDAPDDIKHSIESGDTSINAGYNQTRKIVTEQKQKEKIAVMQYVTLDRWNELTEAQRFTELGRTGNTAFNQQSNDNIEWAQWSWNPVTGCLHNCDYCYARDIANRFYEQSFTPSLWPERLSAPFKTKVPAKAENNIGYKNVFTCSMADLFGKWVPTEWIEVVLEVVRAAPQWNFLFLTKFPIRMAEFEFPDNAWVGTTVDRQYAVERAEKAFRQVTASVKFLSCEPLLEPLQFTSLDMFDWLIVGGSSKSTQTPEFRPPREWVNNLEQQARDAGCKIYEKANLLERIKEYPGGG